MAKIKLDKKLYKKIQQHVVVMGYSSVEEFVTHILEKEIERYEKSESAEAIKNKLKGLGYLE